MRVAACVAALIMRSSAFKEVEMATNSPSDMSDEQLDLMAYSPYSCIVETGRQTEAHSLLKGLNNGIYDVGSLYSVAEFLAEVRAALLSVPPPAAILSRKGPTAECPPGVP